MPTGIYKRKPHSEETKRKIGLANSVSNKGRKLSQETKDKISKANKGKNKDNGRTGKFHTQETKDKISASNKGRKYKRNFTKEQIEAMSKAHSGSNSPQWKGGLMKDKKYVSWLKNKRNRLKKATIKELGSHTYGEWELLKKQYNYTCPCCKLSEPFTGQKSLYLTEDHIIPLSKGGSDLIENIQPLCLSCNIKKHTLIIKY